MKKKQSRKAVKGVTVRELQKQGYKKTQIPGFYVSKDGKGYSIAGNKILAVSARGFVTVQGKQYNFAKLILETFGKMPVRTGQIVFKNGNNRDFSFENLEYKSTITQTAPDEADLIKCIRLYFQVAKKFNQSDILFKYYLSEIARKRGFLFAQSGKGFELFKNWLSLDFTIGSKSKYSLSLKHGFTARNGINEINRYLSLLVNECLQDFEAGILQLKEFEPKPKTKRQVLAEYRKFVDSYPK